MPARIDVKCDGCNRQLTVPSEFAGKRGRCPTCGAQFVAPASQPTSHLASRTHPQGGSVSDKDAPSARIDRTPGSLPPGQPSRRSASGPSQSPHTTPRMAAAWYFSWPVVIVAIIGFFPIGLVLLWQGHRDDLRRALGKLTLAWKDPVLVKRARIIASAGFGLLILLVVAGVLVSSHAKNEIQKANQMYEAGAKGEAVEVYRKNLDFLDSEDKPKVLSRLIDFEADRGNKAEARRLAERAEAAGVVVSPESEKGKELMSEVWREKEKEREAARQAQQPTSTSGTSGAQDTSAGSEEAVPEEIKNGRLVAGHRYALRASFENRVDEWFVFQQEYGPSKIAAKPTVDLRGRLTATEVYWVEGTFSGFQSFQTVLGVEQDLAGFIDAVVWTDEQWEASTLSRIRARDPELAKYIDQVETASKMADKGRSDLDKNMENYRSQMSAEALRLYGKAAQLVGDARRKLCFASSFDDARKKIEDARKGLQEAIDNRPDTPAAVEAKRLIEVLPPSR